MTEPRDLYSYVHRVQSLESATENDLRLLIRTYPVIDNHAHNLLKEEHALGSADYPFECITSEAHGPALEDHGHSSLAQIRGIKQLSELFDCPDSLQDVKSARYEWVQRDYAGLIQKCFQGTHAIMMDDGLSPEIIHPGRWHRKFCPRVSRIVRIESIAAELLEHLAVSAGFLKPGLDADWSREQSEAFLTRFNTMFRNQIKTLAQDPNVRGFKSIVCYRSGLDVSLESRNIFRPHQSISDLPLLIAFHTFLQQAVRNNNYRVQQKDVNDFLVVAVCDVLEKLFDTDETLPFQFHTGLGDTDIDLVKANPAYMQPLIEAFPHVDFVILHSSYPYTREAGYLAANYSNAWLDIGEVFPMLSRQGEESVLRQALELTPSSKLLWSTDGHFYPESYYLANKQFRAVLETVLIEYLRADDITIRQAIDIAMDIMFWNSNMLYKLDEERRYPQLLKACGRSSGGSIRHMVNGHSRTTSTVSRATTVVGGRSSLGPTPGSSAQHTTDSSVVVSSSVNAADVAQLTSTFDAYMAKHPETKYIWAQFVDYTGTPRLRMIPIAQFKNHIASGKYPGITCALPRLMQNDFGARGCSATGEMKIAFDLSTLSPNRVIDSPSATVQTWWMVDDGPFPREHYYACPRQALVQQLASLQKYHDIDMLMGFEIEVVFVRPVLNSNKSDFERFDPLHMVHSWSNMTHQDLDVVPMIEEIVETLASLDINLGQFHAEAAPGQWEFPLPAYPPLQAVDVLYTAREIIRRVARKHGLKATLYPRPYDFSCGSASHAHFSVNGPGATLEAAESFIAGVLDHLPSLLAFTLPLEESYQRILAGIWAGGEYVAWGTQNRETAIRKCGSGHWEMKTVDGIGNMYLSMAALVAAGLHGLEEEKELTLKDCAFDASSLSAEQREELGIKTRLPKTLGESLENLDGDSMLKEKLGKRLVDDYVALKTAEIDMLRSKEDKERRAWLISRY